MLSRLSRVDNNLHVEVANRLLDGRNPDRYELVTMWPVFFETSTINDFVRKAQDIDGYQVEVQSVSDPDFPSITYYGHEGQPVHRTGLYTITFTKADDVFIVRAISTFYNDAYDAFALACVIRDRLPTWDKFMAQAREIIDAYYGGRVFVVGDSESALETDVTIDDIILPLDLKRDIVLDFEAFFDQGVHVYSRLKLNPFRKIMLAGVPGTGKTMIANAIANLALARDYLVVYVSSGDKYRNDFGKIKRALEIIRSTGKPALVIVEEFDAYLSDPDSNAFVLNVLDGSETPKNPCGTYLISTTNHPDQVDDRVLQRPGRVDRIFVIPETQTKEDAELFMRRYLGDQWRDEHRALAQRMVGQPPAVMREVIIHALTMAARSGSLEVSTAMLEGALDGLLEQIALKDDFLSRREKTIGFKEGPAVIRKAFGERLLR